MPRNTMALNFPQQPDVRLENSPLVEVVCQVRFPIILRITSEDPTEFQEHIRAEFPFLELEHGFVIRAPGPGVQTPPVAEPQSRSYRFRTADEQTTISLAADFYALSTTRYTDWDGFAHYLKLLSETAERVYKPTYATRIGLRYINRLTRGNTGCQSLAEIQEILRPELTSYSRSDSWAEVDEMRSRLVLKDNGAKLTVATAAGEENDEPFFVLDLDYFEEGRLNLDNIAQRCARYNHAIYRAFRWCIRDEKIEVFKPKAKELSK